MTRLEEEITIPGDATIVSRDLVNEMLEELFGFAEPGATARLEETAIARMLELGGENPLDMIRITADVIMSYYMTSLDQLLSETPEEGEMRTVRAHMDGSFKALGCSIPYVLAELVKATRAIEEGPAHAA